MNAIRRGKVIREGMGQAAGVGAKAALDCVITNALMWITRHLQGGYRLKTPHFGIGKAAIRT